ncbi:hypothetical protein JFL43_20045 [Viridibacillus sp. YIM B01967]|uniref:Uncharacterized protein n=1 Tax=Viridibacillus soli TaxID=2798301 RepID=A0ABS1HDC8_9BACL|nr:hypothetical protein [Viridibacillus soli]MBK3497082.1 hypothetical protein [Viridibacillus soli]
MKKVSRLRKIVSSVFSAVMIFGIFQMSSASAASADLTQQQKEEYYKQYVDIIKEVNSEQPDADLEVVSFNEITDWVNPDEFKGIAIERANMQFVDDVDNVLEPTKPTKGLTAFASGTVSATKSKGFNAKGTSVTLSVTGNFHTQYFELYKRQLFSGIKSVSSSTNRGTWTQSGYEFMSMDMGTTYAVTTSGILVLNDIKSTHHVSIEFYCTANGGVE